ncbi:glycosyltransferase family 9 protein [Taylorella equigenitalis]|uniref:ADP-heptose--lipooligosaccharide heptosyltransferase II n=2 Tax=Taylorella equigenitalis TaxID=29575 RepID=A0A654KK22_TAYEM|nr:glycosyltransferase family 9 protein [Taylorella equigenitalis]ADU92256.1 ADP-heptose--lipooligosaccharide heptosyltransferase II [Taylorella equigenitalis MCE9]AFN35810.1 ADP-heptose-LPS heptosyltransferase II [Taylorella equigenitalis ATCC 35865]ASY39225.1 ADP-heptose--LPS heptosyltransferase [Taylorella equigenitalis]ASY40743.1 ADP-heptose--LPS heptosyltransferase [Taylorella equigenitalis]WDU47044.1 glycosyltransferase family 9 protein [Taylorella equigenitalis]
MKALPPEVIYVRLPNWVGDVCMCLPSLDLLLSTGCQVVICARPWAKDLLQGYDIFDFIDYEGKWQDESKKVNEHKKQFKHKQIYGLIYPRSISSALSFSLAGIRSAGYTGDARSLLLKWKFHPNPHHVHFVQKWWYLTVDALRKWGLTSDCKNPPSKISYSIPDSSLSKACDVLGAKNQKVILISPTAVGLINGKPKVWPHYEELTKELQKLGFRVVMTPPESEKNQAIESAPSAEILEPLKLSEYVALCSMVDCVIANDSGSSHLASLATNKQISLFGVTDPAVGGPWSEEAIKLGTVGQWPSIMQVRSAVDKLCT